MCSGNKGAHQLRGYRLLWLYSPVYVGPGRKPRRPVFSQRGSDVGNFSWFSVTITANFVIMSLQCLLATDFLSVEINRMF